MDVVLCWHMHQPDYRLDGRYRKPWTWLHAIKDYSDMAAHLESNHGARAVVNFSPVLIQPLQDYPPRIRAMLDEGEPVGDGLLDALGGQESGDRDALLAQLLRVNDQRMRSRFEPYDGLAGQAEAALAGRGQISRQDLYDLLVWYVIAWMGESLRELPLVQELTSRAGAFARDDMRALISLVADVIEGILPRYRKLAERGAVELSVTPYAHPILPLLLDFDSARDSEPEAALPDGEYPGGEARCRWQLAEARRVFAAAFGFEPRGCWPSEGAVSSATLTLMAEQDFHWTASGSQVLHNSLRQAGPGGEHLPQLSAWQSAEGPACFFRDDGLSDLIGFEYSKWPAQDAVDDFLARLERLREEYLRQGGGEPVLSIIMDGENAWEYYEHNGYEFLSGLYTQLADHQSLQLTTFSRVLERNEARPLASICAGSWVHGSFSTWIGDPVKNRAWELLADAKRAVDTALESGAEHSDPNWDYAVLRQLAICEASDWFWWLGEGRQLRDADEFDALFRRHLQNLYRLVGEDPPPVLERPVAADSDAGQPVPDEIQGAMRRSASSGMADSR